VSPDMAFVRKQAARELAPEKLRADATAAIGLEVKKLERGPNGQIARASGLDYNSTPPCGTIRVYDAAGKPVDIRGFYLFVCLENGSTEGQFTTCPPDVWAAAPGTVGRARPGRTLELRDGHGAPVPPGQVGTVWVRVPDHARFTYWRDATTADLAELYGPQPQEADWDRPRPPVDWDMRKA
jgi:acyl-CoA synthetase (AMP-forming)/AMP-acid ligase II